MRWLLVGLAKASTSEQLPLFSLHDISSLSNSKLASDIELSKILKEWVPMASIMDSSLPEDGPALALHRLGLSSRDIMQAISRMGPSSLDELPRSHFASSPEPTVERNNTWKDASLKEFTCFGRLPSELRLKIWAHACHLPRNIDIFLTDLGELRVEDDNGISDFSSYKYYSEYSYSHPAVLRVSRESREEALRHYHLSFGTSHVFSNVSITTPAKLYINFASDRICLLRPHDLFCGDPGARLKDFIELCQNKRLRSIALNVSNDEHYPYVTICTSIPSLEEVMLFSSDIQDWYIGKFELGFGKSEDLKRACPEEIRESTLRDVRRDREVWSARNDLNVFFSLHKDALASLSRIGSEGSNTRTPTGPIWTPPVVESRCLSVNGMAADAWVWSQMQ